MPQPAQTRVRDRIVSAAKAEFSQHGIAGARIDRIAKAARTSKERVYVYFSSKVALYRFVSAQKLAAVTEATRMDPTDLPGYAGRLHDYFTDQPDRFRLMSRGQLELDAGDSLPHRHLPGVSGSQGRTTPRGPRSRPAGRRLGPGVPVLA